MIYIFDDRFERREKHGLDLIKLSQYAKSKDITCGTVDELVSFIKDGLSDVTHVLIHASYQYPGGELDMNKVVEAFYSYCKDVQIVLFSGGYNHPGTSMIGKTKVFSVNSDVMYNNLELFTRHLSKDPNSPIEILLWGKSYLQNQILATQSAIVRSLYKINLDEQIDVKDKDKNKKNELLLEEINEIVADRLRNEEFKEMREALQAVIVADKTWRKMLEDIEDVITKNKML